MKLMMRAQIVRRHLALHQLVIALGQVAREIRRSVAVRLAVDDFDLVQHGAHLGRRQARSARENRRNRRTRARSRYCFPRACRRRRRSDFASLRGIAGHAPSVPLACPLVGATARACWICRCRELIAGEELGQPPHAIRFRPRGQQNLAEIEIRHHLRQLKTELRIAHLRLVQRLRNPRARADRCRNRSRACALPAGSGRAASSSKYSTAPRRYGFSSFSRMISKRRRPRRDQIHAPVGIFLQDFFHRRRAARIHDAFFAGQHHAELGVAALHVGDHLLVALLENVQAAAGSWETEPLGAEKAATALPACVLLCGLHAPQLHA